MKENNQKIQKKSWGIIIAVLSVCIIATAFFDYVNINLAGKIPILDKILEFAGISEEYLKISPSELISHTSSAQDILGELGIDRGGVFWKLAVFLFLPYVFAVISAVFGFSDKTSSEVVSAVSALLGIVSLFVDYLLIIPHSIAAVTAETVQHRQAVDLSGQRFQSVLHRRLVIRRIEVRRIRDWISVQSVLVLPVIRFMLQHQELLLLQNIVQLRAIILRLTMETDSVRFICIVRL